MKRLAIALVVIGLLAVSQVTHAANLEEGWYVKLGGIALWWIDPASGHEVGADWDFTSPLGTVGPFLVTQPDPLWPQRLISVPSVTNDVAPGTSVCMDGLPEIPIVFSVYRIDVSYDATYDPSQMVLEMLLHHATGAEEVIWTQNRPGHTWGSLDVLDGTGRMIAAGDSIRFRVTTVPEPPQIAAFLLGLSVLAGAARRRKMQ